MKRFLASLFPIPENARVEYMYGPWVVPVLKWSITFSYRPSTNAWGRFGGGWQWSLGFEASSRFKTVILNLLVCSVRITRGAK
jgi:hypothetical protein